MRFALHAVERFIERHAPDLTVEEAQAALEAAWPAAIRMRERTFKGQEQWLLRDLDVILVVKRDGQGPIAVSTLPAPPKTHAEKMAEEMAEAEADRVAPPLAGTWDPANDAPPAAPAPTIEPTLPKNPNAWANFARSLQDELRAVRERHGRLTRSVDEERRIRRRTSHGLRIALRKLLELSDADGVVAAIQQVVAVVPHALNREFLEYEPSRKDLDP